MTEVPQFQDLPRILFFSHYIVHSIICSSSPALGYRICHFIKSYAFIQPLFHSFIHFIIYLFIHVQKYPAIAHFKGPDYFMPYSRNALLPYAKNLKKT